MVVAVLSTNSIDSKWVKEEMDGAAIRKIEGRCRILPVVLDGVEVPAVLRGTLYQEITDCTACEDEFRRILDGIFNQRTKPPLGLNRLRWIDRPTGRVIRRCERPEPGDLWCISTSSLVHLDVKKVGKVPPGGGWATATCTSP